MAALAPDRLSDSAQPYCEQNNVSFLLEEKKRIIFLSQVCLTCLISVIVNSAVIVIGLVLSVNRITKIWAII